MKRFLSFLCVLMLSICLTTSAFAADEMGSGIASDTRQEETVSGTSGSSNSWSNRYQPIDPKETLGLDDVSIDDVSNKLNEKGEDIVGILILVCQKVCIGAFILGIVSGIIGLFGNKKMLAGGFMAALLSGICYAAITCGPELVQFIASWAAS